MLNLCRSLTQTSPKKETARHSYADHDNCNWSAWQTDISAIHPPSASSSVVVQHFYNIFSLFCIASHDPKVSHIPCLSAPAPTRSAQLHLSLFTVTKNTSGKSPEWYLTLDLTMWTCRRTGINARNSIGHLCSLWRGLCVQSTQTHKSG